jgi:Inner membrane component of T3SS, cytoplasmic domain
VPVAVVFLLRAVVLILLWGFVITTVVAIRHDVFGTRSKRARPAVAVPATPAPAAPTTTVPRPAPARAPVPTPRRSKRGAPVVAAATRLAVVAGPFAGASVALSSLPVSIGRSAESSIVLNDDYVSHQHAQLIPRGQEWLICDVGSTNGTYVGDRRVTEAVVVPVGGQIRIGQNILELQA